MKNANLVIATDLYRFWYSARPCRSTIDAGQAWMSLMDICVICPSGRFWNRLSSLITKNISLCRLVETAIERMDPVPTKGRFAIVTNAGRDAVDALAPKDERRVKRTAKPCGPDAPTLAFKLSRSKLLAGDGGKKARSPGRARYKP
jgi:hypothetical protein